MVRGLLRHQDHPVLAAAGPGRPSRGRGVDYIREKTLEGPGHCRGEGEPRRTAEGHRRRLAHLRHRAQGQRRPGPQIAKKLTIKTGKNAGKSPSVASLYRALAEAEEQNAQAEAEIAGPRRPVPARITGPGSGTGPELMERLERQVLAPRD